MTKSSVLSTKFTKYSKDHPFYAKVTKRVLLTPSPSTRRTYHIELDISESNLSFKSGASIGVLPENTPAIVSKTIQALKVKPDDTFFHEKKESEFTYLAFIQKQVNLKLIPKKLSSMYSNITPTLAYSTISFRGKNKSIKSIFLNLSFGTF